MVKILGHSRVANHSAINRTYCLILFANIKPHKEVNHPKPKPSYDMHQRHDHHEHTYHSPTLPDSAYDIIQTFNFVST